jgi:broad specificity phosphatase PhoE
MIHLIRHGHSSLVHDGRWFTAPDVGQYEDAYDAAGIRDDSHPPRGLVDLARSADLLVASDLVRAIESARRLAPDREPEIVPDLRELRLEPPRWIPLPLPITIWDSMSYLQWAYRMMADVDHAIVRRAKVAADWLLDRANGGTTIVAVTHGGIRPVVAKHLVRHGCTPVPGPRSYENWSCWSFAPPHPQPSRLPHAVTRDESRRSG